MRHRIRLLRKRLLTSVRPVYLTLPGGLLGALLVFPSFAEDTQVGDVIVGRNQDGGLTRDENRVLLEAPRSGGIVSEQKAQEEHLERLSDLSQFVPNYRPNIANPQTSRPAIRGIGSGAGSSNGVESDTGFIIDNVFWKSPGFQWADFPEVQAFELGLGPQGTAGGKNTTVGNIILKTQLPSFARSASIETTFSNYAHILEKVNLTGPIIDDQLAYRLVLYYDKGGGYFHDAVNGEGLMNNNRWGARGQLLYVNGDITDRFIFNYSASHEFNNNSSGPFDNSLNVYANGTLQTTYAQQIATKLHRVLITLDPYEPANVGNGTLDERQNTISNELNYQIGENTLTSISAWGEFRLLPRNTTGNELISISNGHTNNWTDQYSEEVRLASPKDQPLEWKTGLYALYEKIWNGSETIYGSDAAQFYGTYTTSPLLLNGLDYHQDGKAVDSNVAAYGQATYHYNEQAALTFGLRDGYEVREGSNFGWEQYTGANFSPVAIDAAVKAAGNTGGFFDTGGQKVTRNLLTGIVNPAYKYSENILFYSLIARGEKAGAVNFALPNYAGTLYEGFQPVITKAEYSWDYEIGTKTNWFDNHLIANVNFYWTDVFNFQANQVQTYTNNTGQQISITYLGSVPHVRLRGIEWDARYSPIDRLWLTLNGALTDARYIDYVDAPPPPDWTWKTPTNPPPGYLPAPTTLSLSNTRWSNLPMWTFNVGGTYSYPLGPIFRDFAPQFTAPVSLFGYFNASWEDKIQFTNPRSVFQYWQPPFTIVNFGVGLRTDDEHYSLSFWVKNLFDRREILNASPTNTGWSVGSSSAPATIALTTQPRYFGGTFLVKLF